MVGSLVADAKAKPIEWLQLGVPAALYTIQNNMLYIGFANLESAIGLITYQIKMPLTAVFSVILLSKALSFNQWISLFILSLGIILVQDLSPTNTTSASAEAPIDAAQKGHHAHHAHAHHVSKPGRALSALAEQQPLLGVTALLIGAVASSFAGVYFEKMLKGASQPSLWLRNAQLAVKSRQRVRMWSIH